MSLLVLIGTGTALAQAPPAGEPAPESPESPERIAELEARVAALEARLAAEVADDVRAEAEALAAAAPLPPPAPPARAAVSALNPGLTVFGDVVGQLGVVDGAVQPGSTVFLRSLELQLRADVDPFAKADAVIAWEQEAPPLAGGPSEGFETGPEEAYIDLVALPARLSARAGKFRVPFGLANRLHPHDLPWTLPPELLGEEGYIDTGVTLAWLLPLGPAALTLTAGGLSGEPFDEDAERASFAALGRAELFVGAGAVDVSLGGSALRDVPTGEQFVGADAMVRWRRSSRSSFALLGEAVAGPDGLAGYAAAQVQPARNVYLGFREDLGDVGPKHNLYLTYYTSEFLRVRAGAGYAPVDGAVDALAQLTFVWGSHPVEPWWVNR